MTEFERMEKGLLYDCNDQDILKVQLPFVEKHWDFNQLRPTDFDGKQAFMKEVFAECGENCYIELPLGRRPPPSRERRVHQLQPDRGG